MTGGKAAMSADWRKPGEVLGQSPAELLAQHRRVFTISNGISLLRIVALPFLLYAISLPREKGLYLVVGSSAFIALTDLLDGFIARRLGQVSEAGKIVDPVADKICIGAASVWLSIYRGLPAWIPTLVIGRDVLIVVGSVIVARRTEVVLPSNQVGRLTTNVLTLTLFSYAIDFTWPQEVFLWMSGTLIVISFAMYLRIAWHILRRLGPRQ